jgi:hypothetical protein
VIPVGADGWPTGDFGVTLMAAQAGVAGLAGTYRVVFNGRATVTPAASGTVGASSYDAPPTRRAWTSSSRPTATRWRCASP